MFCFVFSFLLTKWDVPKHFCQRYWLHSSYWQGCFHPLRGGGTTPGQSTRMCYSHLSSRLSAEWSVCLVGSVAKYGWSPGVCGSFSNIYTLKASLCFVASIEMSESWCYRFSDSEPRVFLEVSTWQQKSIVPNWYSWSYWSIAKQIVLLRWDGGGTCNSPLSFSCFMCIKYYSLR